MVKEIEFSKQVDSFNQYKKIAQGMSYLDVKEFDINRTVYKKANSKFFIKISEEIVDGKQSLVFSYKEDLMDGDKNKIKKAKEVDIELDYNNKEKIKKFVKYLGFKKGPKFRKKRERYIFPKEVFLDFDTYYVGDEEKRVIEIEAQSEQVVLDYKSKFNL